MRTRPRVLVVEDEPDIARVYCLIFSGRYDVEVAPDLATARTALRAHTPALVILDLRLPDGDGLELCRELKASHPTLPIVVISANRKARDEVAACGADAFVPKPPDLDEVERTVDDLIAA
jgi:DNA-binding response OmpR family regulator